MQRRRFALVLVPLLLAALPKAAQAGGPEFPAGGTRSLGRGAAGFARADDPSLMTRNPALLADLWDDQAMLGAHLLLPDACMQPTGAYGWGVKGDDVSDFGQGPRYLQANPNVMGQPGPIRDTDLKGNALKGYGDTPFPKVCYQGPAPFLPQVALSMKPTRDLGVGIGFFPPDTTALNQWGNRDGTIDTPDGKLPNPLRYYRSHLNVTFFSLLGGVGYRLADWISVGAAFQWSLVAFYGRSWTEANTARNPANDVKSDAFGRDLFVPGGIVSVQLKPIEALDIAVGFKWSDRVKSKAKLDITSGAFGTGEPFTFLHDGTPKTVMSSVPTRNPPVQSAVDSPPIWVPQLAVGVRFADRLKPKPRDDDKGHHLAGKAVEDHMLNERWDIEADAVYYFNSVYDSTSVVVPADSVLTLQTAGATGISSGTGYVGKCQHLAADNRCTGDRKIEYPYQGKNQISARIGGDYNILPGVFAVRAGLSYETDGQDPQYLNLLNYMLGRIGIHGGFTIRVAERTDISFAFAHFIQKAVKLQLNTTATGVRPYDNKYKSAEYHFEPGLGVPDRDGNNANGKNGFDGMAKVELPNGDLSSTMPGPDFINAGSYYYHLEVVSLTIAQHF